MPRRLPLSSPLRVFAFFLLLACGGCERDDDEADELEVLPSYINAYQIDRALSFAVGLRSQLRVTGSFGMDHPITAASCADRSCRVERAATTNRSFGGTASSTRGQTFLVTPLAPTFRIHVELIANAGEPTAIDKELTAVDGAMGALHRGAGPGVPFIAGTTITWYIAPRNKHAAWEPDLSAISVTPPFELVSKPQVGGGPDNQTLVGVHVRATKAGTGTLTHMNGDATATFPLVAVGREEIRKLHVAPIAEVPQMVDSQPLSNIATDRISVASFGYQSVWIVFETAGGEFGIAGAGDCLPAAGAGFDIQPFSNAYYSFGLSSSSSGGSNNNSNSNSIDSPPPPEDQPFLTLKGVELGTSQLLLRAGDATGSADVVVGRGL